MSLNNRYDFVLLFDVKDGNPNGDPDAGNMPRIDAETGRGLVTDVCLKRKVRNYVTIAKELAAPYNIYVQENAILNNLNEGAYADIGEQPKGGEKNDKRRGSSDPVVTEARQWMCQHYYDVRTFGAVMSTNVNCGQVRGPIQLTFSRSIDPIVPHEHSITRMAATDEKEAKNLAGKAEKESGDNRTMGRKHTIPYGLYRCHGFISAHLARQTGFSEDDLELFFTALEQMFEHDRSAARGEMATRGLYVFKHDSLLGNAHANKLFEHIAVNIKDKNKPPRDFADYIINVDKSDMPAGVEMITRIKG